MIAEAVGQGVGEIWDDAATPPRVTGNRFHIVEARNRPLRLADWIGADDALNTAEEQLADSDRVGADGDEGPWFEAKPDQAADLAARLRRACDEWQAAHGLTFHCTTFDGMRNADVVNLAATVDAES